MAHIPEHLREEWETLDAMTDAQLESACADALELTARSLVRLAIIVRIKEQRGHDLSKLKIGLLPYLRRIADGDLLPEVVARCAHRPAVINQIGKLALTEQRAFLDKPIPESRPAGSIAGKERQELLRSLMSCDEPVVVDTQRKVLVVTGAGVIITLPRLREYLHQLGGLSEMYCVNCGESAGHPSQCSKCGSKHFEHAAHLLVA